MNKILAFLSLLFLCQCYSQKQSNFDVSLYEGVDLSGKAIVLKDLPVKRLIINVYAPTCIPCVKEIPALNYLYKEVTSDKSVQFFLVADPYDIVPDADLNASFEDLYPRAKLIMEKEIFDKKINLPILIMKKPFRVSQGDGLVTGRPETMLFKTNPLILYYNFIGPISEESDLMLIQNSNKVKFFKSMLGGA